MLQSLSKSLRKNLLLVLGQRPSARDESTRKISTWFVTSPHSLCLHLAELSKADTTALTAAVMEANVIPRPLAGAIFEKCRGHPRFVLEVSELLLAEEKVIVEGGTCRVDRDDFQNLRLPNNVRAVLVSRIDQLR